jgi:hypothetical protein
LDYLGLPWTTLDYLGLPWITLDYLGLPWIRPDPFQPNAKRFPVTCNGPAFPNQPIPLKCQRTNPWLSRRPQRGENLWRKADLSAIVLATVDLSSVASAKEEALPSILPRLDGNSSGTIQPKFSPNDGLSGVWGAHAPRVWWSAPSPNTSWHLLYFLLDEWKQSAKAPVATHGAYAPRK